MNQSDVYISIERDEEDLAGSNVVSLNRPAREPVSIGDLAAVIVSDAAVRLRGNFELPKIRVRPAWED
jgi:hypothetical protein